MDFGRGDLMAVAATRYCLGRMTYIVGDCADWLIRNWSRFEENARFVIQRDVEEAFRRGDVGMDCDRRDWERVRALWATPPQSQESDAGIGGTPEPSEPEPVPNCEQTGLAGSGRN